MKMHQCNFCDYQSSRNYNLKVHVKNKHYKAPTNTLFQPEVAYSSTELPQVRQGLPLQSGSGVLHTTQQYDPRAKPQIQNNEVKHKGKGPQTSVSYSVSQKPEDTDSEMNDNETDTETVSEADTEDLEEYDVF